MKRLVLTALAFFLLANVADLALSQVTPQYEETNPFARDAQHSFVLSRGIKVKATASVGLVLFAAALYVALAGISAELGAVAVAAIFFWWGADVLLNAAVPNFMLWMGWFVP